MTDPKITLMQLLENNWGLEFTPKFSTDWYDGKEKMPQVVVSQVLTRPRFTGFTEDPATAERRFEVTYAVDVWSKGDQTKRQGMIDEVDRIIHSKCDDPGGGLEFAEVSNWRDLDEGDAHPRLYRSRLHVEVLYYA
ncbi:MAG: hypothetical protein NWF12_01550 [Candidatus Bathyarchaeota archaeon]|nr:hypothetical protein [Candidatus Bathyarchaeota archaeon]